MSRRQVNAIWVVLLLFYANLGARVLASVNSPAYRESNSNIQKLAKLKAQEPNSQNWIILGIWGIPALFLLFIPVFYRHMECWGSEQ